MTQTRPYSNRDEQQLMSYLWDPRIVENPLAFVMFAYPWGQKGTRLENEKGPRKWQREVLEDIAKHILDNKVRISQNQYPKTYQLSVASGRGIGKSALVSWLIDWNLCCHLGSSTIVAANSEDQLKTKTWAELGVWRTLSVVSHWFDKSATNVLPHAWFQNALKKDLKLDSTYYYAHAQLWSEEKPENFAGVHNPKGVMVIFDEASGIPKPIWTIADGFFTDICPYKFFLTFSNPRRNTGPFYECFHGEMREFWRTRNIDSRTVEGVDKDKLDEIIKKHGDDSDEARVEVKGQFPRHGDDQFISSSLVQEAIQRELVDDPWAPLIMGVDVARFGNDSTVIRFRQGRNARVIAPIILKRQDNMTVANMVAGLIQKYNPDGVCVDSGAGSGVIDRLRELGYKIHEIKFGGAPIDQQWADKRTEIWAEMSEWLKGGCIEADRFLVSDLCNPQYKFVKNGSQIRLESKEEMKKRSFASPDHADALAVTFGAKIARKDLGASQYKRRSALAKNRDYDLFG